MNTFGVTQQEAYELGYAFAEAGQPRDCYQHHFDDRELQEAWYRGYDSQKQVVTEPEEIEQAIAAEVAAFDASRSGPVIKRIVRWFREAVAS